MLCCMLPGLPGLGGVPRWVNAGQAADPPPQQRCLLNPYIMPVQQTASAAWAATLPCQRLRFLVSFQSLACGTCAGKASNQARAQQL